MSLRPGPVTLALLGALILVTLAAAGDLGAALLRPLARHLVWLFP